MASITPLMTPIVFVIVARRLEEMRGRRGHSYRCCCSQIAMPPFASFSPFCSSPADNILSALIDTSSPLPHCNLFFSSLLHVSQPPALVRLFTVPVRVANHVVINVGNATDPANGVVTASSNADDPMVARYVARAGTGVGVGCDVGRVGVEGSLGDIGTRRPASCFQTSQVTFSPPAAQIIACAVCFLSVLYLIFRSIRRRAAVGRAEMVHLFVVSLSLDTGEPASRRA